MREKSIDLMTGCVRFFNSALIYFNHGFFGSSPFFLTEFIVNLLKTIGSGGDVYEDGKRRLETAIKEYDQAVFDLTAMIVASNFTHNFTNISSFSVLSGKCSKAKARREILKMAVAILLARRRPIVVGAKATWERHSRVG